VATPKPAQSPAPAESAPDSSTATPQPQH
jgi:hypothetical protein